MSKCRFDIMHLQEEYCSAATIMQCTWLMFVLHDMGVVHDHLCLLLDRGHCCCIIICTAAPATSLSVMHLPLISCVSLQPTIGYLEEPDIDAFQ